MIFRTLKLASALTLGLLLLASCKEAPFERPVMDSVQTGYRRETRCVKYGTSIVATAT
jgi:hypothetical protein